MRGRFASSSFRADSAKRGCAISFVTLAIVALAVSFVDFFFLAITAEGAAFQWNLAPKGSFQAVKLQRPARATVCSHSTSDMAAVVPSKRIAILLPTEFERVVV